MGYIILMFINIFAYSLLKIIELNDMILSKIDLMNLMLNYLILYMVVYQPLYLIANYLLQEVGVKKMEIPPKFTP